MRPVFKWEGDVDNFRGRATIVTNDVVFAEVLHSFSHANKISNIVESAYMDGVRDGQAQAIQAMTSATNTLVARTK